VSESDPFTEGTEQLHTLYGFPQSAPISDFVLLDFRLRLLEEEVREVREAVQDCKRDLSDKNVAALLHELADVQAVLAGFTVSFGIPLKEITERVYAANLTRLVDGKPLKTPEGKMLKGPNYSPPDMLDLACQLLLKIPADDPAKGLG
jgi:NTP pyrophosphatase (non-canonical NTP hydrolase)